MMLLDEIAYDEGSQAAVDGIVVNPYPPPSSSAASWHLGWMEGYGLLTEEMLRLFLILCRERGVLIMNQEVYGAVVA